MKKNVLKFLLFIIPFVFNCLADEQKVITSDDVKNFVINISTKSSQILNNPELNEQQKEIEYKNFTNTIIDSNWVAKFILGSNWKNLNLEQKEEFTTLYKEYLLQNYMPKLKDYSNSLSITKIEKIKEQVYLAYTKTKDKDDRSVNVNFRIIEKDGNLYIIDIIPEGISFISSQRTDVNSSITKNGYNKFIKELKQKIRKE